MSELFSRGVYHKNKGLSAWEAGARPVLASKVSGCDSEQPGLSHCFGLTCCLGQVTAVGFQLLFLKK